MKPGTFTVVKRALTILVGLGASALWSCGSKTPPTANASGDSVQAANVVQRDVPTPPASASVATRRHVSNAPCQPTSCDYRTETCCEAEINVSMTGCVKKSEKPNPPNGQKCSGAEFTEDRIGIECLTSEDCGKGLRCCKSSELTHCAAECDEHEACVPNRAGTCHAGSKCEASSARSGGECVVAEPGVTCGKVRCSGEKAGCRYDRKKKRGECIALLPGGNWPDAPAPGTDVALMRCTSPKDCAGERCCTGGPMPMTDCSGQCMSGIDVCETVNDCPDFIGPPTGCTAAPEGPPFLKTCQYGASK